jgi:superoxide reductase
MTKKSDVHKCSQCGCIIAVLEGGEGQLQCCGQQMLEVTPDEAKRLTYAMSRPGSP